jgi:hypothetical protein
MKQNKHYEMNRTANTITILSFILTLFFTVNLHAWDGDLPLDGWKPLYSGENATVSKGIFTGSPVNPGASLMLNFKQPESLKSFNCLKLRLDGKLTAADLILSIRGTKNISIRAASAGTPGNFIFCFQKPPAAVKQLRVYFNAKNRFCNKSITFELKKIKFGIKPAPKMLSSLPWEEHQRVLNRTWIFPRIQNKYDLMKNYLGAYSMGSGTFIDRPLFFDRTLADSPLPLYNKLNSPNGFRRQLKSALEFTDGFGVFASRRISRTLTAFKFADEKKLKNVILLEISPAGLLQPESTEKIISAALASPAVFKFNGKLVINNYHGQYLSPAKWQKALEYYRAKFPGKLLFLCELRGLAYQIASAFNQGNGKISETQIEKFKAAARSYLNIVDGINFSGSNHIIKHKPGFPENVFNAEAYEKFIVPLFVSVLNEAPYAGKKLLGLSAHKVYCQVRKLSSNVDEEGTFGLRRSLGIALAAKPDLIVMPEWNEVNENTHIEPVVSDAKATVRVVNAIRGRETADIEKRYPNLILSFRQENEIGAPIPIELLGLPDKEGKPYSVILKLFSPQGKLLKRFPPAHFSQRKIETVFHLEPTIQFADYPYLITELELKYKNKTELVRRGLPHIRLVTPRNIHHRYVKIPLRDLPSPENISTKFKIINGKVKVSGHVECPELINSVELMADDIPLAAVGAQKEFTPPKGYKLLGWIRQTPTKSGYSQDKLSIRAIKGKILARTPHQYGLSGMHSLQQKGKLLSAPIGGGSPIRECLFFATPDAELEITQRGEKAIVKVADVLKNRRWRKCATRGVSWQIVAFDRLIEMPLPLDVKKLDYSLSAPLASMPNPVYYLRVVTRAGRVFRSEPVMAPADYSRKVIMPVWDLIKQKAKRVSVPAVLARDIVYDFNPRLQDILPARSDIRTYDARIGGFDYWTHSAPGWDLVTPPNWIQEDGRWILDFKKGDAVLLVPPAFSSSAFTIEIEFRLKTLENQTILNLIYNKLPVKIKNGMLCGSIVTKSNNKKWNTTEKLVLKRWYKLKLNYDLEYLNIFLDDRQVSKVAASNIIKDGWILGIGGVPLKTRQPKQDFFGTNRVNKNSGFNCNASIRALRIRNF